MGMSVAYGERDETGSVKTIYRALEIGANFIDTADIYGMGHNEELVGRALKGRRQQAILATKFGNSWGPDGRGRVRADPDYVTQACENSLARLGTEVIDLYYLHRLDPTVPIEDTVGAMAGLVAAGKVRHIGLSEVSPATLARAHEVHPIAALQNEYSLWTRDVEAEILPACRRLGIGLVAYSPLGRGFLTDQIAARDGLGPNDRRRAHPRFSDENLQRNRPLAAGLRAIAGEIGATPAQLAIAWLVSRGDDVASIPGTKKPAWLEQNVAAASLTLGEDAIARLEALFRPGAAAGDRYPAADMAKVGL